MMQKILTILVCVFYINIYAQTPTPYTAKITANSGAGIINATQNSTRICPVNGDSVEITAYAGWPFGSTKPTDNFGIGGYLYISNGNIVHLPCGSVTDFDSIKIDVGGTLIIDDYNGTGLGTRTGNPWSIIGCKGSFILNGTILCRNGAHHGGTWQLLEPDSAGNLTSASITANIIQRNGGDGGAGGNSFQLNNGQCSANGGAKGLSFFGNGGGGGGGAGMCSNPGSCSQGENGGNANDTLSGYGGHCSWFITRTPGVGLYGQNGNFDLSCNSVGSCNCCSASSNGGAGGTRGKHGGLLYIKAMKSIIGAGTIDVGGQKGGDGGASDISGGASGSYYSGSGGGGGGAAGGSGGYLYVKYVGLAPTYSPTLSAGIGGIGGVAGSGISSGVNGANGQAGLVGQQQIALIPGSGYTYQWYKSGASINGATKSKLYTKLAGYYDCRIINPSGQPFWTSGIARFYKDTVYSDSNPISVISSINPSNTSCVGDTIKLTAQYASGQMYQWLFNGTPIGPNSTVLNATQAGTYAVLANNSCNGNISPSVNLTFNIPPAQPSITALGTTTFCPGGNVVLQSSSSLNNVWSANAGGLTTQTVSVNQSGNYQVTVSNSFSCSAKSLPINVTVKPASVNAGADVNLLCGGGVTLNPTYNPTAISSVAWTPTVGLNNSASQTPYCQPSYTTTYIVTANFTNGCVAKDTIKINSYSPPPQICMVTTDSLSNYNEIYWEKSLYPQADSFFVYRETSTNFYKKIGGRSIVDSCMFIDTLRSIGPNNGNPNISYYKYKIAIKDNCGNVSVQSDYHSSIYIYEAPAGTFHWNIYDVETTGTPVSNYLLWRRNIISHIDFTVGYTSGTVLADPAYGSLNVSDYKWYVDAVSPSFHCDPAARKANPNEVVVQKTKTKSNHANDFTVTKLNQFTIANIAKVYPNPAKENVTVELSAISENMSIHFNDVLGRTLYTTNITQNINTINTSAYVKGIYFINIIVNNKTVSVKKVVIE